MAILAYSLCTLAALACALMLMRGYLRSGFRLLLWSSLCFFGLTLSNAIIFFDLIILPNVDLHPARLILSLGSMALLIFGLVWESR